MTNNNYWQIGNILLSKELIEEDTQENQINYHKQNPNSPKPISYPELFQIGRTLANNNISNKDEVIQFLRQSFKNSLIQTSSGILYRSNTDLIIHDKGLSSEKAYECDFVGPDGYIEQDDEQILKLLTRLDNIDEIKEISKLLAEKDKQYIWRVNSRPNKDDYRVARFYAYSDGVGFGCGGYPTNSDPALGVFVSAEGTQKSPNIDTNYSLKEISKALKKVGITGDLEKTILEELRK